MLNSELGQYLVAIIVQQQDIAASAPPIETKDHNMKKILVTGAILSMLSAQVFAQEAATAGAAGQSNTSSTSTGTAAGASASGGFFGGAPVFAGLSTGALVALGTVVAAVAVAASDSDSTPSHSTTTHH
jgi:hypothetical protein